MLRSFGTLLLLATSLSQSVVSARNTSSLTAPNRDLLESQFAWSLDDRPKDCPPCFNCLLPAFHCTQFADCSSSTGKCECPPGFAGDDCLQPLCGSLGAGTHRPAKGDGPCECDEGWEGINCNVCKTDDSCRTMYPEEQQSDVVCYKQGIAVKENFQQCDVTNKKILEMLKRNPQVTFSCNKAHEECTFQFWVDQRESFYCNLNECEWDMESSHDKNITNYQCKQAQCECISGRTLCGEGGTIDLSEFLQVEIKGPATFQCDSSKANDQCYFSEPNMNNIITSIFGDETILLDCDSGECLHKSEVPGYKRPIKTINKPLIAGVIAGCALFLVAVVLGLWYLGRRANQRRGAIYLSDDDDEALRILAEHKPAALHFSDVCYTLNGKKILEGVRGSVSPGQVMAIMGPSGAGKTTFLDILARKNKRGSVNGNFLVNGAKVTDEEYKEISGFVDQEDTMMATLTVYETILNSALLRLPRDMTFEAKNRRVMDVMGQLGIMSIKDQLIGTSEDNGLRGVSGGEKRRVSIACELVTSPSILFLDEPTSGLDSYNAYNVVECLVSLAKNYRRTVIFTIHQPKSNIVALFDQLVLLAKGRCVYSGPFDRCQEYFVRQGYSCPPGFNIADYLVDLTVHAEKRRAHPVDDNAFLDGDASSSRTQDGRAELSRPRPRKRGSSIRDKQAQQLFSRKRSNVSLGPGISEDGVMLSDDLEPRRHSLDESEADALLPPSAQADMTDLDVLIESYGASGIAKEIQEEIDAASAPGTNGAANGHTGLGGDGKGFTRVGWFEQFKILSARTWKNLYRNPQLMLAHYAISIVLAVLCGYLFFGIKDDISGFQNRMGLFFFVLALFGFSTLTSLNVFAQERTLFLRERANGYYSPITYFTSKVLFDIIPLRIIPPIIMGMLLYPMVGLVTQWPEFFKFILVLVLFNLSASAICLFIGIVFKDNGIGNLVGSLVMLFSLLFAGLLLNHNSIPAGALWAQNLSIFHFGFEALIVNEVRYLTLIEHKFGLDIEVPGATILSTFGFHSLAFWNDVIGLSVFAATFIVLAYLAMHFLLVERR